MKLTIFTSGYGIILTILVDLRECQEHHRSSVTTAGQGSLSQAAHGDKITWYRVILRMIGNYRVSIMVLMLC